MKKIKVLFVCIHNSARSQMAEAYMNSIGKERFEAESAGIELGKLNSIVVQAMKEDGMDISGNRTKDVFEFLKQGKAYDYVITVCDETSAEKCPVFPGIAQRVHWSLKDPSAFEGTDAEKLEQTKVVREEIKYNVREFIATLAYRSVQ